MSLGISPLTHPFISFICKSCMCKVVCCIHSVRSIHLLALDNSKVLLPTSVCVIETPCVKPNRLEIAPLVVPKCHWGLVRLRIRSCRSFANRACAKLFVVSILCGRFICWHSIIRKSCCQLPRVSLRHRVSSPTDLRSHRWSCRNAIGD
jgi:hypothetical protein